MPGPPNPAATVPFPLLADPSGYHACETDLLADAQARSHWLSVFERQLPLQLDAARDCGATSAQLMAVRQQFTAELAALHAMPARHGRLDILLLDEMRQAAFRRHGIPDEMRRVKQHENDVALAALPDRLALLAALDDPRERFTEIIRGMLAGNLFDMGAAETAELYRYGGMSFGKALAMVPTRPWLVDDTKRACAALESRRPRRAVIFADNAGGDLVLGLLPLVRELLQWGAEVVLTANSEPSHNDITHPELCALMPRITAVDPLFTNSGLSLVASGSCAPLIDLRAVSLELAAAAARADFLILVGMGRALETNYTARFTVPTLKVAMVKDAAIARGLGGKIYDAVCRFDAPA